MKYKKLLLYISCIPYVYLIISGLYYAIVGYDYGLKAFEPIYGVEAFIDNIFRFWGDNFFSFNFIGFICVFCIGYQIWYFINARKNNILSNDDQNSVLNNNEVKDNKKLNIPKIIFIISIACWVLYFLSGIYALLFGYKESFFFSTTYYYGFDAFIVAMFWNLLAFTYIPVLPVSLLYIIIYLISSRRKKKVN